MTDAKHEAPAEGAGEAAIAKLFDAVEMADDYNRLSNRPKRLAKDFLLDSELRDAVSSLRARSSAPEVLGNLLAVIHRDGGHRTLEVGVEQAAAEAEKIVANLLSSAPEAREDYSSLIAARCVALPGKLIDCPVCLAVDNERDRQAAPSADKLREFGQHTNLELSYRHGEEGDDGSWQVHRVNGGVNDREWTLIGSGATPSDAIRQALATLKAEGGK